MIFSIINYAQFLKIIFEIRERMALIDEQFMIAYDRLERKNITDRIAIFSDSYECTKHQHTLQQIVPKIKYWK